MKFFCDQCKKPFEVSGDTGDFACPLCQKQFPRPEQLPAPGMVLGDFLIERSLSKGGMGEVFLARQISLDRDVALKVLQSKYTNDQEYIDTLFAEARAAAKLNHPNIVQAYAVGEEAGIYYFAMEYVRGDTFKAILKNCKDGKLEFEQAAKVICDIAKALDAAWREQKLVHQDIKPDNIMLDANGFAKLADLGLAKTAGANQEDSEATEVLGTPQYISPEQLTGVPTDVRSDIYSLGATFYQFVTGHFPYEAPEADEIAKMHVAGNLTPPVKLNAALPENLNNIIVKMMARYPEDRYQTPEPLIKELQTFIRSCENGAPSVPKIKKPGSIKLSVPGQGAAASKAGAAGGLKIPAAGSAAAAPKIGLNKPAVPPAAKPAVPPAAKPAVPPAAKPAVPPAAKPAVSPAAKSVETPAPVKPAETPAPVKTPESSAPEAAENVAAKKASAEKKERRPMGKVGKSIVWSLIIIAVLLLLAIAGAVTAIVLKGRGRSLGFADPAAERIYKIFTSTKQELQETVDELATPPKREEVVEVKTSPEFIARIEELYAWRLDNPEKKEEFLSKVDNIWLKTVSPNTPEETAARDKLISVFSFADEMRFEEMRRAERSKHLAAIAKIVARREKAAQERAEAARRDAEAKAAAERQQQELAARNRREQAALQTRLAQMRREIAVLQDNLIKEAAKVFLENPENEFAAISRDINRYCATNAAHPDERKLSAALQAFLREINAEFNNLRRIRKAFLAINEQNYIMLITPAGRGIVYSIKPGEFKCRSTVSEQLFVLDFYSLASEDRIRITNLLSKRTKLNFFAFYMALIDGHLDSTARRQMPPFWKKHWKKFQKYMPVK